MSIFLQKGWIRCQEVTVQVLLVKDLEQDAVWGEAKAKGEAEWEDHMPPARAEVVYARTVRP
jgi:hypothetical protein